MVAKLPVNEVRTARLDRFHGGGGKEVSTEDLKGSAEDRDRGVGPRHYADAGGTRKPG